MTGIRHTSGGARVVVAANIGRITGAMAVAMEATKAAVGVVAIKAITPAAVVVVVVGDTGEDTVEEEEGVTGSVAMRALTQISMQ